MAIQLKATLILVFSTLLTLLTGNQEVFALSPDIVVKANAFADYIESHEKSDYFGPSEIYPDDLPGDHGFLEYEFADYDADGEYELCITGPAASANALSSILDEENGNVICRFHGWGYVMGRYSVSSEDSPLLIITEGNSAGEDIVHLRIDGFDAEWRLQVIAEKCCGIEGITDFTVDSNNYPIDNFEFSDIYMDILDNGTEIPVAAERVLDNCSPAELASILRSIDSVSDTQYILPESANRYLTKSDIDGFSLQKINYAKNEIYARHGRKFKSKELMDYFSTRTWYSGTVEPDSFSDSWLSEVERSNALYLRDIEFADGVGYLLDQEGYDVTRVIETLGSDSSAGMQAAPDSSQYDNGSNGLLYTEEQALAAVQEYGLDRFSAQGGSFYIVSHYLENPGTYVVWYHWPTGFVGKYSIDLSTGEVSETGPYESPDVPGSMPMSTHLAFNVIDYL